MMLKVRALSSEGRMTAVMLTALPILSFTILFTFNARFFWSRKRSNVRPGIRY